MKQIKEDIIELPPPNQRDGLVGHGEAVQFLLDLHANNALSNGWMLTGAPGIGKATLAYHLTRKLLANSEQEINLVNQRVHPDLFVAERQWDEKKQKFATEISVETIRNLISSFERKADKGMRVAIVDTADELNRNAANALLKVLEEPPRGALILLLASSPGRLLPTIRSRCRVLSLKAVPDEDVSSFLAKESSLTAGEIAAITQVAEGRPGYALELAMGEGSAALALADEFLNNLRNPQVITSMIERLSPKATETLRDTFETVLQQKLSLYARQAACGTNIVLPANLHHMNAQQFVKAWEYSRELITRSRSLNTDKAQQFLTLSIELKSIFHGV